MPELIGLVLGTVLTLFVLSYVAGDNPLYRFALYLFVGTLVGYSFGIVIRNVLVGMAVPGVLARQVSAIAAVALGILLLLKGFPKHAYLGNLSIAYLVGVGAAVALGGALLGTIVPQITATGRALSAPALQSLRFGLVDGILVVVGTCCTLLSFTFVQSREERGHDIWGRLLSGVSWIGRVFMISAFGMAYAGALTTSLSILIGRIQTLIDVFSRLAGG